LRGKQIAGLKIVEFEPRRNVRKYLADYDRRDAGQKENGVKKHGQDLVI
jgi:hypothetical protein